MSQQERDWLKYLKAYELATQGLTQERLVRLRWRCRATLRRTGRVPSREARGTRRAVTESRVAAIFALGARRRNCPGA